MARANLVGILGGVGGLWTAAGLLVAGPAGTVHYPDLSPWPASDIGVQYNASTGSKLLTFTCSIANIGQGPLQVNPVNNASTGTTDAYQILFSHDTNDNWYGVSSNYVGTFVFHPAHNHWHFQDFARYELRDVGADGSPGTNVLASNAKVSFCIRDDSVVNSALAHFAANAAYTNCDQVDPQGISVGWADVYSWTLADQNIDVSAVPDGDYWLVITADPDNRLNEGGASAKANNVSALRVRLAPDLVWFDDSLPAGATPGGDGGDGWNWVSSNPTPYSGTLAHQSNVAAGFHDHWFYGATFSLGVHTGNVMFAYVYLDPNHLPAEIMLEWNGGTWEHRAYWGANNISLGTDGTASRQYLGPLPAAGQWVRLEVPASQVGLENQTLTGMAFAGYGGRATWDRIGIHVAPPSSSGPPDTTPPTVRITAPADQATVAGTAVQVSANASDDVRVAWVQFQLDGANLGAQLASAPYQINWNTTSYANGFHTLTAIASDAAGNRATSSPVSVTVSNTGAASVWVDDSIPNGATASADNGDFWNWISNNPPPYTGSLSHQSNLAPGYHDHWFNGATNGLTVSSGSSLFAFVYLDPANLPSQVMLQWYDGSWEHRAYWGANLIALGTDGTASRSYAGPLPAAGQWVELVVPASQVGLAGRSLTGMAFTLYNGRAAWDYAGAGTPPTPASSDTTPPAVAIDSPTNHASVSGSAVSVSATASDNVGVVGVQFQLDGSNLGAEVTSPPYQISWNTTLSANGSHTLLAVARDAAGNQGASSPVTVTVNNTSGATVWVEDSPPAGASADADFGDAWNWVSANPTPYSGSRAHQSNLVAGYHDHWFGGATATLNVTANDTLFCYIYLDALNPPSQVMLQWYDGSWEHRAYWGANLIGLGTDGTTSRMRIGPLPPTGQWVRLEVAASAVGLGANPLSGMAFTLYDGRATWDYAGK